MLNLKYFLVVTIFAAANANVKRVSFPKAQIPGECGVATKVACSVPIHCAVDQSAGAGKDLLCKQTCTFCSSCRVDTGTGQAFKLSCSDVTTDCCSEEEVASNTYNLRHVACNKHDICIKPFDKRLLTTTTRKPVSKPSGRSGPVPRDITTAKPVPKANAAPAQKPGTPAQKPAALAQKSGGEAKAAPAVKPAPAVKTAPAVKPAQQPKANQKK
ncbi:hypothetical protein Ciccas_011109 [Cichlidogyrus casuarinus]|uniref:Uncharacterized protein n=1 Tax=Cichlidogyrus casuarinus TaxID=1844966 RepID=A0ABD2PS70_9PLAT